MAKATAKATLTLRARNRATLARQMLLAREKTTVVAAVERLVGLQAQLARPPFVGLWSRVEGFTRAGLAKALLERRLVRATMMRATLHLVSKKDYAALRPVLQPALTRAMESVLRDRSDGLDRDRVVADARAFLGKGPATFEAVRAFLAERHPKVDERAMGYTVRLHLPLVQVPTDAAWGFPATAEFALADAWIGKPIAENAPEPDALVLRYLAAYGPASIADMQGWSAFQGLRAVVDRLRPKLEVFTDERGRELFDVPDGARPADDVPAPVRFLPEWDNLIVGRADDRFLADRHRKLVYLPGLRVLPTILVDGFVAGTWKVESKKKAAALVIEPFEPLAKKMQTALETEGKELLRFVEESASARDVRFAKPRAKA